MSKRTGRDGEGIEDQQVTVDDLFRDLSVSDAAAVAGRVRRLGTDVMLAEGAGTLVDAVAYIRVVAQEHGVPGSEAARRLERLADELVEQAAVWQQASDSAAISIRAANKRHQTQA
jgi:hypothetical protein